MIKGIHRCKTEYIRSLLHFFQAQSKGSNTRLKVIKALNDLARTHGTDAYIHKKDLQASIGNNFGISRWIEAGVVEKQQAKQAYRIRKEFRQVATEVLSSIPN